MSKEEKYLGKPTLQERRAVQQDRPPKPRRHKHKGYYVVAAMRCTRAVGYMGQVSYLVYSEQIIPSLPQRVHWNDITVYGEGEQMSWKEAHLLARELERIEKHRHVRETTAAKPDTPI